MAKAQNILIVTDYQKDFIDGALAFEKAKTLEDKIYDKVNKYLKNGESVFFTFDTHYDNYLSTKEGKLFPIKHCIAKTEGWNLYGKLKKYQDEGIKNTYKIFKKTFGSNYLPYEICSNIPKVGRIELCGLVTHLCVLSNAVILQNHLSGADILINAGLCASFNNDLHEKALDIMQGLNMKVIGR